MFTAVVAVCNREGLIGRELFVIDGVKLPSNASKARSGTRADFARQAAKREAAAKSMVRRHRATDATPVEPDPAAKAERRIARLERNAAHLRTWLAAHPEDRRGARGAIRKRNQTDNESAKMATGKGVIQGYTGVAAVDGAAQIIVEAQAHGTGSEQELRIPVVPAVRPLAVRPPLADHTCITADAGYHSDQYARRFAAVEPVFANLRQSKRLARFTLRGRAKVDGQRKLFCLVHTIEKLANPGYAAYAWRRVRRAVAGAALSTCPHEKSGPTVDAPGTSRAAACARTV